MKRGDLLRHLRKHRCHLKREGRSHSLWTNPATGAVEAVPRRAEISDCSQDMPRSVCARGWPASLANKPLERPGVNASRQSVRSSAGRSAPSR